MKIRDIEDLFAFSYVFEERSFTKAAERLGVTKAAVAKRIASLELEWKTQLFRRSTRIVMPTDEGNSIYRNVQTVLDSVKDLEASFAGSEEMEGNLRITCAAALANRFVAETLGRFQDLYPKITIQLIVTDSLLDLVEENIDIAIRIGKNPAASLSAKRLFTNEIAIAAAPSYLRTHPKPERPEDLFQHNLLFLDMHEEVSFLSTKLSLSELKNNRRFVCNDAASLIKQGLSGKALLIRSIWDFQEYIHRGELVQILANHPLENFGDVWLLTPISRVPSRKVKGLVQFFEEETKKIFNQ
ncbi:LysR family transcriptional regulator [Leptospira kobayashii]|uniref:LysR family transcriptional regulator n=1 Tax=Leptospira kobayashii TaxID=1917830 RepID=A0ABM7UJM6_9LEPT|nr:LysR family transcriptional regulator [Leptospira kobayashii]BDA79051.1 LysR family transcriptional regulator [Leptospira kobayashii]